MINILSRVGRTCDEAEADDTRCFSTDVIKDLLVWLQLCAPPRMCGTETREPPGGAFQPRGASLRADGGAESCFD